jgi:hypothetical protein
MHYKRIQNKDSEQGNGRDGMSVLHQICELRVIESVEEANTLLSSKRERWYLIGIRNGGAEGFYFCMGRERPTKDKSRA